MSRKVTVTFFFYLMIWRVHASGSDITWTRDRTLDDVIKVDGYPHTEVAADSAVHCASLCTSVTTCSSFFFLKTTRRCLLNEFVFVKPDGGQGSPGARYFKPNNPACSSRDGYVWLRGQRTCFKVYLTPLKTFIDAYEQCHSGGSRLALLDTRSKVIAVLAYIADDGINVSRIYIGAARDGALNGSKTTWNNVRDPLYWLNGVKVATNGPDTYWQSYAPDNADKDEGCLEILKGKWNDCPCTVAKPFICDKDVN